MSPPRKQTKLPPPDRLKKQRSLQITLPFAQACRLISFKLVEPDDFAGQALEVAASDLDALTDLIEMDGVEMGAAERLLRGLQARIELAVRINDQLKKAGAV